MEHLDELVEIYLAEKVLENIRAGKEETVSLNEVIQKYGLGEEIGTS